MVISHLLYAAALAFTRSRMRREHSEGRTVHSALPASIQIWARQMEIVPDVTENNGISSPGVAVTRSKLYWNHRWQGDGFFRSCDSSSSGHGDRRGNQHILKNDDGRNRRLLRYFPQAGHLSCKFQPARVQRGCREGCDAAAQSERPG